MYSRTFGKEPGRDQRQSQSCNQGTPQRRQENTHDGESLQTLWGRANRKTREGRKSVPNNKMPDLAWDIAETQLTLEAQKENSSNMTPPLQTLVTVIILIIMIVRQTTAGIKKITKKAAQVIENTKKEARHNRLIKNIKDFHRTVTSVITIATNLTNHTNHKEQVQINNKTARYSSGTRKLDDKYDESYQSLTPNTYSEYDN